MLDTNKPIFHFIQQKWLSFGIITTSKSFTNPRFKAINPMLWHLSMLTPDFINHIGLSLTTATTPTFIKSLHITNLWHPPLILPDGVYYHWKFRMFKIQKTEQVYKYAHFTMVSPIITPITTSKLLLVIWWWLTKKIKEHSILFLMIDSPHMLAIVTPLYILSTITSNT